MLDLCWIVHNWPFRHYPHHLSPRQAPLISLTSPSGTNAATPTPRSRRLPQTSPQNTTPDDSTPHVPTIMQSLFVSHGISTTWKLYEVVHRSRPHRPALHADHCCALSLFLYDFYLLAQSTTFILGRILNGGGCVVGTTTRDKRLCRTSDFLQGLLRNGGQGRIRSHILALHGSLGVWRPAGRPAQWFSFVRRLGFLGGWRNGRRRFG